MWSLYNSHLFSFHFYLRCHLLFDTVIWVCVTLCLLHPAIATRKPALIRKTMLFVLRALVFLLSYQISIQHAWIWVGRTSWIWWDISLCFHLGSLHHIGHAFVASTMTQSHPHFSRPFIQCVDYMYYQLTSLLDKSGGVLATCFSRERNTEALHLQQHMQYYWCYLFDITLYCYKGCLSRMK